MGQCFQKRFATRGIIQTRGSRSRSKEAYIDENEEPKIIGEMNRDAEHGLDDISNLGRLALAEYNHGVGRVILTTHKAYLVTSDIEEADDAMARQQMSGEPLL